MGRIVCHTDAYFSIRFTINLLADYYQAKSGRYNIRLSDFKNTLFEGIASLN